jgi:protein phosphatase
MDHTLSVLENRLNVSIRLANKKIHESASKDVRLSGMGTTVVIGQVADDRFYVAHVGDSRCYRIRDGQVKQLTRDHSLLEDYKEARPGMSDEEQRKFPHKNVITRALGMRDTVQVDITSEEIQDGDIFLLCSDGLSGMVPDVSMPEHLRADGDLDAAVNKLVGAANAAGGTDNITVLVLECRQS